MKTTKTRSIKGNEALFDRFEAFCVAKGKTFNAVIVAYIKRVTPK